ncbi:hypothetical protein MKW92_016643 [Papaver armeniacum]|nr:hypothetical protein MKW92_016643 [Papaver armeniacum]
MDLGTVKSKIAKGEYPNPLKFCADVRLTFSNAMRYNPPGHHVHTMARELGTFFEARWKAIENELLPVPLQLDAARDTEASKSIPPSKKMKISSPDHERKMTYMELLKLNEDLQFITEDSQSSRSPTLCTTHFTGLRPLYLTKFLREQCTRHTDDDEVELDLEMMTGDTLFTLRKLAYTRTPSDLASSTHGFSHTDIVNNGPLQT